MKTCILTFILKCAHVRKFDLNEPSEALFRLLIFYHIIKLLSNLSSHGLHCLDLTPIIQNTARTKLVTV